VTAVCCQIGDGATPAAQQAMKDAVTRNQLAIQLPPRARRSGGAGYVQQLSSTSTPPVAYMLAKSDASPTAYLVTEMRWFVITHWAARREAWDIQLPMAWA